jgi:hypothetical protein
MGFVSWVALALALGVGGAVATGRRGAGFADTFAVSCFSLMPSHELAREDCGEIVSPTATLATPTGRFVRCLKIEETSFLQRGKSYKLCAEYAGRVADGELRLVRVRRAAP